MAKGIGEAISLLVLFTVVLAISLSIYFYTMFYTDQAKALLEYVYVKTMFNKLADAIVEKWRSNYTNEYSYPHELVALGYEPKNTGYKLNITLGGNNSSRVIDAVGCSILKALIMKPVVSNLNPLIVRGVNYSIVRDVELIPLVYEYYANGSSILVLDTCRAYYTINLIGGEEYLEIAVFNLTGPGGLGYPRVVGQGLLAVSFSTRILAEDYNVRSVRLESINPDLTEEIKPIKSQAFTRVTITVVEVQVFIG